MGNYAHLFTSDSETPNYTLDEDDICLQAKYTIPAFWCLLFNSESYRNVMPVHQFAPDPDDAPDHFFTMEHGGALECYSQRESRLFEVIPSIWEPLSKQFVGFLNSKPLKFIHLSVGDLASMTDDGFEERVQYVLDALSERPLIDPTGLFAKYRKQRLHDGWSTLLGLADIHHRKVEEIKYWNLAGVGEGEDAPWDES